LICPNCGQNNSIFNKLLFKYEAHRTQLPCKSCDFNLVDESRVFNHFIITTIFSAIFYWFDFPLLSEWVSVTLKIIILFLYFIFLLPIKKTVTKGRKW
jgi:uncharacterized protein (DUF983 family)